MMFDKEMRENIYLAANSVTRYEVSVVCNAIEQLTERKIPVVRKWEIKPEILEIFTAFGHCIKDLKPLVEPSDTLKKYYNVTDKTNWSQLVGCVVLFEYDGYIYTDFVQEVYNNSVKLCSQADYFSFNKIKKGSVEVLRWKDGAE